jgi:hypothetical protein
MSEPMPCGCCEGITAETPATIDNRPGLSAISYRPGTWAQFKASMLDALSTTPALAGLRTRDDDDFTIALLDAWAVACDILTFYQERIANEAYLRTATELVSVGELAKLIGYKLRPGLAASAALSFTMNSPPPLPGTGNPASAPAGPASPPSGSPASIALATGTQAQSVPDPGNQPATFETIAPITGRAEWNAIAPRMTMPPAPIRFNAAASVRLTGLVGTVKVGDSLLVTAGGRRDLQRVASVTQDMVTRTTLVRFKPDRRQRKAEPPTAYGVPPPSGASLDDTFLWRSVKDVDWTDQGDLVAFATAQGWSIDDLEDGINALRGSLAPGASAPVSAYAMGIDASLFGHNAAYWYTIPPVLQAPASVPDLTAMFRIISGPTSSWGGYPNWEGYTLATIPGPPGPGAGAAGQPGPPDPAIVDLDNVYPVVVGDQVVLQDGDCVWRTTVSAVQVPTRSGYLMSAKLTSITLAPPPQDPGSFGLRTTRVLVQTAELPVADVLCDDAVSGGSLTLNGAYLSLAAGQLVAVTGVRADKQGQTYSEVTSLAGLSLVDGYTVVTFNPPLAGTYVRSTVTINANVAPATHGATTAEILGSGNASQTFQSFPLKQPPLTYVSAATPSGAASTLVVRVNGVAWTEVDWLYGSGSADQVYVVLAGADGNTYVQFGDGVTGACLPSGTNNVQATYRSGIGRAGLARAGQISTLLSRPLGLNAVTNPLASTGAADPETIDQARPNAPLSVLTLARIVSLEDAGNFAAASAGVAKAAVSWVWDSTRYVACVTVAGVDGAPVPPGSPQYASLLQAMIAAGDGTLPLALCSYVPKTFTIGATITPDPALVPTSVLAAVTGALAAAFSFASRGFGQPVFASEVISTMQNVPGVVAVTLGDFRLSGAAAQVNVISAASPTLGANGLIGAELVTVEPGPLPGVVLAS